MEYLLTYARTVVLHRIIEIPEYTEDWQQAAIDIAQELDSEGDLEIVQIGETDPLIIPEHTFVKDIVSDNAYWNLERI